MAVAGEHFKIGAAVKGDLSLLTRHMALALRTAQDVAISRRTGALKKRIRTDITKSGLGTKLPLAVRSQIYTSDDGASTTGVITSKATKKGRPGGYVDLLQVFNQATTIVADQSADWLAIPNRKVVGPRATVASIGRDRLWFWRIRQGGPVAALVLKRGASERASTRPLVAFWLVRKATLKRRINLERAHAIASRGLDDYVAREFERQLKKAQYGLTFTVAGDRRNQRRGQLAAVGA